MNIETANRLYELRKKNNLSQEDLADKLGISRQAVSKWERAEASPDTDNLILLAKLYGVSLDELLNMETASSYQEENKTIEAESQDDTVSIDSTGILAKSEDGEEVHIGKKGIYVKKKNGEVVDKTYREIRKEKKNTVLEVYSSLVVLCTIIAYLVLGFTLEDGFSVYWILFVMIPVEVTLVKAIQSKRFTHFAYPCLVTSIYLFLGMKYDLWHPWWVLFLSVPVYYTVFGAVDHSLHKDEEDDEDEDKD